MARRFSYLIVVLVLALLVVAIPESRRVMVRQFTSTITGEAYPGDLPSFGHRDTYLQGLSGQPQGVQWDAYADAITRYGGSGDDPMWQASSVSAAVKPIELRPGRPESYALALMSLRGSATIDQRVLDAFRGDKQKPRTTKSMRVSLLNAEYQRKSLQDVLNLAEQGSKLAPQNAFFDLSAASALYTMHRDAEAIQRMQQAAGKKEYDSYIVPIRQAVKRFAERNGMPQLEASNLEFRSNVYMPGHLTVDFAMTDAAKTLASRGHSREAELMLIDLVKIGNLIASSAHSRYEYGSGIACAEDAGAFWLPISEIHGLRDKYQALGRGPDPTHEYYETITSKIRAQGWMQLAHVWDQDVVSRERFTSESYKIRYTSQIAVDQAIPVYAATETGTRGLWLALALFALAGLMRIATWARGRGMPVPPLSLPGQVTLAIVAVLPWLAMTLVETTYNLSPYMPGGQQAGPPHNLASSISMAALLAAVSLLLYRQMRSPGRVPRWVSSLMLVPGTLIGTFFLYLAVAVLANYNAGMAGQPPALPGDYPGSPLSTYIGPLGFLCLILCFLAIFYLGVWRVLNWRRSVNPGKTALVLLMLLTAPVIIYLDELVFAQGSLLSAGTAILAIVTIVFTAGRVIILTHAGACDSLAVCSSESIRSGASTLAKVLLVLYFAGLLGQLPFRYALSQKLQITGELPYLATNHISAL